MRIRNPPKPTPDAPIIIYLPCGFRTDEHDRPIHNPLNTLALSAHATVVEIGYRLSPKSPYPKPIHDVIAGYDWIRKHLSPSPNKRDVDGYSNTKYAFPPLRPKQRIGVCGELAGGSLAAMLALAECNPNGITAAALGNPIVDWSSPLQTPVSCDGENLNRSIKNLHTTSFAKAEHRYDPFASPLLFFRTPAYELPTPSLYGTSFSLEANNGSSNSDTSTELVPRRRSHRKYPPLDSGLRFPATRIDVGPGFTMKDQAIEFAELMQRSVNLYEEKSEASRDRIEVVERGEDGGLWKEKDVMEIGRWMGEMLRRD
ncbi:MAG: hypothetical protein L6R38_000800 [Xanthoria sp. 2 TBL-2021]|nr:MAG: hypothetical protein L6R38_000800 [Xanthoria sp. 2 TBL-2021]